MKKFEDYKISGDQGVCNYGITKITPITKNGLTFEHCEEVSRYFNNIEELNNCNLSYEEMVDNKPYCYSDWYNLKYFDDFTISNLDNFVYTNGQFQDIQVVNLNDGVQSCDMYIQKGLVLFAKIKTKKGLTPSSYEEIYKYDHRGRKVLEIIPGVVLNTISYNNKNKTSVQTSCYSKGRIITKWNDDFTKRLYEVTKDEDENIIAKTKFDYKEDGTTYVTFMHKEEL